VPAEATQSSTDAARAECLRGFLAGLLPAARSAATKRRGADDMHAADVLRYGDGTFRNAIDALDVRHWSKPGATGHWSPKDIVAHLASYEQALQAILSALNGGPADLSIVELFRDPTFNDREVDRRADRGPDEVLAEYTGLAEANVDAVSRLEPELLKRPGLLEWYGDEYDLEDFLIYTFYGHKREHAAQINAFRDLVETGPPSSL
jgi:hypothetical protein